MALKRSIRNLARRISNGQVDNMLIKHYYSEKKRYNTLVRKKHRQYKAKILNSLVDMEKTNPNEFWKLIDKFKNEVGNPSERSGNISPEDWSVYFRSLLNSNNQSCTMIDKSEFLQFSCTTITDCLITFNELQAAVKTLKNNTSSGLDRISNEMLKQSTSQLKECICKLFNIILNNQIYPSGWRENILKPIHKKGSDTDPSKKGSHLYTCFVDFEMVFDTVWRDALFKKLECIGISGNTLKILESMYLDVKYSIKLPYGLTDSVQSSTGLKQGCVLSPLMFNLYVNDLPFCFNQSHDPVIVGKYLTNVLMYADDLVLLSTSKEGLQKCLDDLNT